MNWVDWVILAFLTYYSVQGWQTGFVDLGLTFITFVISFILSVQFHGIVGGFLTQKFGLPSAWTTVIGYLVVGFAAEIVLSQFMRMLMERLPIKLLSSSVNKILGVIVSLINALVLISFFLILIMALPLRGTIKLDLQSSKIGSKLLSFSQKYAGSLGTSISNVRQQTTKFFTIEPDSKESLTLDISPATLDLLADSEDEQKMVDLVNSGRARLGIAKLIVDPQMTAAARAHSLDMFTRKYFAHVNPEGLTPADRLTKGGVTYTSAGENIAYTPDLSTAHNGFVNSPEHLKNMMDTTFHRIGIGIINTKEWGMMVTQDYAN